jgi:hypothetical protein
MGRRQWSVLSDAAVVLAAVAVVAGASRVEPSGPLLQGMPPGLATQTQYLGRVHQHVSFGGFDFTNTSPAAYTVLSVVPTNRPSSLHLRVGLYRIPARGAIGAAAAWVPLDRPPLVVRPGQAWEPIVEAEPMRRGLFTIDGVLMTYEWQGHVYETYVRDQFTLCVGPEAQRTCQRPLAVPPASWPPWTASWMWIP